MPKSYENALCTIEPYLVTPITYDICQNDCIVYRGAYGSLKSCPICESGRYISEISCTLVRRYKYLPLKPRIERLFGNTNFAAILKSHTAIGTRKIFDIQQSRAWDAAYSTDGIFCGESRGISLALCTDGVNPSSHNRVTYSMWPIVLTLLNLPRKFRNKFSSILLVGIIPGNGTKEASNLNPYLDILVDELLEMSSLTLFDAYQQAPFECKVSILLYIQLLGKLCQWLAQVIKDVRSVV